MLAVSSFRTQMTLCLESMWPLSKGRSVFKNSSIGFESIWTIPTISWYIPLILIHKKTHLVIVMLGSQWSSLKKTCSQRKTHAARKVLRRSGGVPWVAESKNHMPDLGGTRRVWLVLLFLVNGRWITCRKRDFQQSLSLCKFRGR